MSEPDGSGGPTAASDETNQLTLPLWNSGVMKLDNQHVFGETESNLILQHLFSEDYETRQKAIAYLNINKHVITKPLVDILVKNITHHTLIFQITYALEVIGKSAVPVLIDALNQVKEIKNPLDETLIENVCETLIRINDTSAAPILLNHLRDLNVKIAATKNSIEQITKAESATNEPSTEGAKNPEPEKAPVSEATLRKKLEFYQAVSIKIHFLMGEMNSPDGLPDLLTLLGDGSRRVQGEIIETLGKIGNKNALLPLIRMYPIEAGVSELGARYIKLTCREIIRRDKVSKSDPIFKSLSDVEKDSLDKILSGHRNGHKS